MSAIYILKQHTLLAETHKEAAFITTKDTEHYELKRNHCNAQPNVVKKRLKEILHNFLIEAEHFRKLNKYILGVSGKLRNIIFDADKDKLSPDWSGFQTWVSTTMSTPCTIVYTPLIPFSVNDPTTVYTCMKINVEAFILKVHQADPVYTLYLIIFDIQWTITP